jgi:hypothetical protein
LSRAKGGLRPVADVELGEWGTPVPTLTLESLTYGKVHDLLVMAANHIEGHGAYLDDAKELRPAAELIDREKAGSHMVAGRMSRWPFAASPITSTSGRVESSASRNRAWSSARTTRITLTLGAPTPA